MAQAAVKDTNVLYSHVQEQAYDRAVKLGYLLSADISTLREQDAKWGRVLSFRIHLVSHGPFGLPVAVRLDVTRERGITREVTMKHGSKSHMLLVSMDDKGILK